MQRNYARQSDPLASILPPPYFRSDRTDPLPTFSRMKVTATLADVPPVNRSPFLNREPPQIPSRPELSFSESRHAHSLSQHNPVPSSLLSFQPTPSHNPIISLPKAHETPPHRTLNPSAATSSGSRFYSGPDLFRGSEPSSAGSSSGNRFSSGLDLSYRSEVLSRRHDTLRGPELSRGFSSGSDLSRGLDVPRGTELSGGFTSSSRPEYDADDEPSPTGGDKSTSTATSHQSGVSTPRVPSASLLRSSASPTSRNQKATRVDGRLRGVVGLDNLVTFIIIFFFHSYLFMNYLLFIYLCIYLFCLFIYLFIDLFIYYLFICLSIIELYQNIIYSFIYLF